MELYRGAAVAPDQGVERIVGLVSGMESLIITRHLSFPAGQPGRSTDETSERRIGNR